MSQNAFEQALATFQTIKLAQINQPQVAQGAQQSAAPVTSVVTAAPVGQSVVAHYVGGISTPVKVLFFGSVGLLVAGLILKKK